MIALALGLLWASGLFLLLLLWPWQLRTPTERLLLAFLAFPFGAGLTSCTLFLCLMLLGSAAPLVAADTVMTGVLGALLLMQRRRINRARQPADFRVTQTRFELDRIIIGAFGLAALLAMVVLLVQTLREPHGLYDAISMWNARARLLFLSGGDWRSATSSYLPHADYPLLLPLNSARVWFYHGAAVTLVPALLALLFTVSTSAIIFASVTLVRGGTQGLLAALVSLGPFAYLHWGGSQYADIPFACFVLIALVLICLQEYAPSQSGTLLVLAGLAAGFAAWTKNEGMLFLLAVVTAYTAVKMRTGRPFLRNAAHLLSGALPVLALVIVFKLQVAGGNDILGAQTANTLVANAGDASRYFTIGSRFGRELVAFGNWTPNPIAIFVLYALMLRFRPLSDDRAGVFIVAATLCIMLFGYLFVYVITPRDLVWHLSTSLDRLLLHLWPGTVFLFFLLVRSPSDFTSGPMPVQPHNVSPDNGSFVV